MGNKVQLTININKELDEKFREIADRNGKQYNLSIEEAIRMWKSQIKQKKRNNKKK